MSSTSFLDNFTEYKDYAPAGVLLPKIDIDEKYYSKLNIDREKLATQRQIADKNLQVARENKNRYDVQPTPKPKKKKEE